MSRRQVHVRVRLDSGETIEALVLEWLTYPDRALVQLPSRQRPSVVRLNAVTGLYSPRFLPVPSPRLALALAGLVVGGVLLGFLLPASPPARPIAPVPGTVPALAPSPVPAETAGPPQPGLPAPLPAAPSTRRATPRPHARARSPHARSPAPALTRPAVSSARASDGPSRARAGPARAVRYETRLAVLSAESARRGAHVCGCGQTFRSAQELEAHRSGIVYSCIRYPKCQVTSAQPQAILRHYEQDRDSGGRCWRESVRLGSAYAVVKRPACPTLAADPNRRKVIKVRVRPNLPAHDGRPWR